MFCAILNLNLKKVLGNSFSIQKNYVIKKLSRPHKLSLKSNAILFCYCTEILQAIYWIYTKEVFLTKECKYEKFKMHIKQIWNKIFYDTDVDWFR